MAGRAGPVLHLGNPGPAPSTSLWTPAKSPARSGPDSLPPPGTGPLRRSHLPPLVTRYEVLKAAKAMDVLGNAAARVWVSAVKAMVPERVCKIIDDAIQIHGATGLSQWTPLAEMYASQRTLRLADGPDEVHWFVVGRAELARWTEEARDYNPKASYQRLKRSPTR